MFALDDTFFSESFYRLQAGFYLKGIAYFFGVILFFEILRSQVSEIDILQLVPGVYFFYFFISFLGLIFSSDLLFRVPVGIDNLKSYGTRVTTKMEINIVAKISILLFFCLVIAILNTVIPLSLDTFNSSGEKTLENTWSLDEVLGVEIALVVILTIISQIPLFFVINFNTQTVISGLTQSWKIIVFATTLLAGLLTPTLDGYTQISFALASFSFYLFIVNFLQKRVLLRFTTFLTFG